MKGKLAAILVSLAALLALVAQARHDLARLTASRLLHRVELISLSALQVGRVDRRVLQQNLRDLRQAGELDPLEVGIPMAVGSQYLLLNRPEAAAEAYREALALEQRPELWLNLGKAQWLAGQRQEAQENFRRAVAMDWHFEAELPRELREGRDDREP